jgi:hypothetical protein
MKMQIACQIIKCITVDIKLNAEYLYLTLKIKGVDVLQSGVQGM